LTYDVIQVYYVAAFPAKPPRLQDYRVLSRVIREDCPHKGGELRDQPSPHKAGKERHEMGHAALCVSGMVI
jgi:hypothetical protein